MSVLSLPKTDLPSPTVSVSDLAPSALSADEQSEAGKRVSEEIYWQHYYNHPDFNYEWNNGLLEIKPMADFSKSQIFRWFLRLLEYYLSVYPLADIILLEIGFRLHLPHKTTIRKPDLGLILRSNQTLTAPADRTYRGVFDLCLESLSDSTRTEVERDVITKKAEYEAIGVQEYYILDDQGRHTIFYERTSGGLYQPLPTQVGGVIASQVLPGFQFRLADLYRQPHWETLVEDAVYQSFVLPAYQTERERANQAEQHLLQERQQLYQVEQALTQAEQAAATSKASTLTLLRQSLAHRFDLPLDYYDQTLSTLDHTALAALSEQVFRVPNQDAFEVLLERWSVGGLDIWGVMVGEIYDRSV